MVAVVVVVMTLVVAVGAGAVVGAAEGAAVVEGDAAGGRPAAACGGADVDVESWTLAAAMPVPRRATIRMPSPVRTRLLLPTALP